MTSTVDSSTVTGETNLDQSSRHLRVLLVCGIGLWCLCLWISLLSRSFAYETPLAGRPICLFLILLAVGFGVSLVALKSAVAMKSDPRGTRWILLFGLGFRFVLLPSEPIQEIDIYRYMWDGAVVAAGGNPYQFSPRDIRESVSVVSNPDLQHLVKLRDRDDSAKVSLQRIHYAHLTTIYPPVSQAVFAAAAVLTPVTASVRTRMILTKLFITAFDFLAVIGLLKLLRLLRLADGWVVCYAWSPLVLKEFANSGHLDAIAVGITAWAVFFWLKAIVEKSWPLLLFSSCVLGLGVGAKLYPIVIVPVVAVSVFRHFALRGVLLSGAVLTLVVSITIGPMLLARPQAPPLDVSDERPSLAAQAEMPPLPPIRGADSNADAVHVNSQAAPEVSPQLGGPPIPGGNRPIEELPSLPVDFAEVVDGADITPPVPESTSTGRREADSRRRRTGAGLDKFMLSWKMNDFFFLICQENLTTDSKAWFSIIPDSWKRAATGVVVARTDKDESQASFLIARVTTAVIHFLIAMLLAVYAWRAGPDELPGLAFLSIAWFWLLLPTLNPWYWIWAMPLLPFARLRTWLLMSGSVIVYYVRFYLQNDLRDREILSSGYYGADFFHYVVVWFEYLPLLLLLMLEWYYRRKSCSGQ